MSQISAPLKDSVLFSPRTANYVSSFIREGDKFDYYKWLQQVRGEAAQAKELPQPITSGNNVTARIDTPNSILDCRTASPNRTLFTGRMPIPGGMRRSYQESISRTSSARIGRRLEAICGAWDDFQANRARDAVYGYLEAVFRTTKRGEKPTNFSSMRSTSLVFHSIKPLIHLLPSSAARVTIMSTSRRSVNGREHCGTSLVARCRRRN